MESTRVSRIRKAIASGEYRAALEEWRLYARELEAYAADPAAAKHRLEEAGALVEWSRSVVLCAKAQARDLLNGLQVARSYGPEAPQCPRGRHLMALG